MSLYKHKTYFGIAFVDITTGDFTSTSIALGNTESKLMDEIARFAPSEMVVNSEFLSDENLVKTLKRDLIYIFQLLKINILR